METMDKRSGAMQSRMDSNKVGCPPAFAQPHEKNGIALTHSSHSLYDYASMKRNNSKKKEERERSQGRRRRRTAGMLLDVATRSILLAKKEQRSFPCPPARRKLQSVTSAHNFSMRKLSWKGEYSITSLRFQKSCQRLLDANKNNGAFVYSE